MPDGRLLHVICGYHLATGIHMPIPHLHLFLSDQSIPPLLPDWTIVTPSQSVPSQAISGLLLQNGGHRIRPAIRGIGRSNSR